MTRWEKLITLKMVDGGWGWSKLQELLSKTFNVALKKVYTKVNEYLIKDL